MRYIHGLAFFILVFLNASSAESIGYSVSPSKIEGSVPAGKQYNNVFTVKNLSKSPITINVTSFDRTIDPLDKNWFKLEKDQITLPAGKSGEIGYSIAIPEKAQGEYDARVIFAREPTAKIMGISMRYNFPVYILVSGTEKYGFSIENVTITNKQNTKISVDMINTGNVHIRPKGKIKIVSKDSEHPMIFNKRNWAIIPNEKYQYVNSFTDQSILPDGDYTARIEISAGSKDKLKTWSNEINFSIKNSTVSINPDKTSE